MRQKTKIESFHQVNEKPSRQTQISKVLSRMSFLILLLCISLSGAMAQSPQSFNYQTVVRNTGGAVVANQNVSFRFTVHNATASGTSVYEETQSLTTNSLGLVSCAVGSGTVVSGTFSGISWGSGAKYLQVEIDPTGGTSYTSMGAAQLLSVPYALYAANGGGGATGPTGAQGVAGPTGPAGATGAQGATGSAGTNGTPGVTGPTGPAGTGSVNGTVNYVAKFTPNGTSAGNSQLFDNGTSVGVGTNTPNFNFQVNASGTDGSIQLTNGTTGGSTTDGLRLRVINSDASIQNNENGNLDLVTNANVRIRMTGNGYVGIGTLSPSNPLDVQNSTLAGANIVNIKNSGAGSGLYANIDNVSPGSLTSQSAIRGEASTNIGVAGLTTSGSGVAGYATAGTGTYGTATSGKAVYGYATTSGTGGYFYSTSGYGVIVASGNVGIGMTAPTYQLDVLASGTQGAIHGSSTGYGVTGECTATAPGSLFPLAGVTGIGNANSNCFYGLNTYANTKTAEFVNTGTAGLAIRAAASSTTGAAIQIEGSIKVAGSNKAAFIHTTSAANTASGSSYTTLSYSGASATDIVFVTHSYNGLLYHNHPVGVWWTGAAWAIYNEDNSIAMVNGDTFNILVIKQ